MPALSRFVFVACAAFAFLTACTRSSPTTNKQTYSVEVDGHAPGYHTSFAAYFPSSLTVHPGDSVDFKLNDSGEPHTVTLGRLVDAAFSSVYAETIGAVVYGSSHIVGVESPDMARLPRLLPDAPRSAANPCFRKRGEPGLGPCPQGAQPDFDGTQAFYSSGWLNPDRPFRVQLSPTTAPGTYTYFCLVHRVLMSGTLTVVSSAQAIEAPATVARRAAETLRDVTTTLRSTATTLEQYPPTEELAGMTPALAGARSAVIVNGAINEFSPKTISIHAGGGIAWTILGRHTISFDASQSAKGMRVNALDGPHLNPQLLEPAGGSGSNSTPPAASGALLLDGGAWGGQGFRSSGLIFSLPPDLDVYRTTPAALVTFQLTFTRSGSYRYLCLVHDEMEGIINVS